MTADHSRDVDLFRARGVSLNAALEIVGIQRSEYERQPRRSGYIPLPEEIERLAFRIRNGEIVIRSRESVDPLGNEVSHGPPAEFDDSEYTLAAAIPADDVQIPEWFQG